MNKGIIFKTLLILGSITVFIFLSVGYLFYENDKKLIGEIRDYNLKSAMDVLDKREEIILKLHKEQIENSVNRMSQKSSLFLVNYDIAGLKEILMYDLKKEGIKGILIWDSVASEPFLLIIKKQNSFEMKEELPKDFEKYTKFKKDITHRQSNIDEKMGEVVFFYDESIVTNDIALLKKETKNKIDSFNKNIDKELHNANIVKLYIAFAALIIILLVSSILLIKFVNNPLKKLQNGLNEFFLFLQNKTDSVKKIDIDTDDEFGNMSKSLNENISVSAKLHEEIYELNTNLEQRIIEKTKKVTTLLDNSDQGFLSFGEDMIIDNEYSKECINIFKEDIENKNIAEILYKDENKREFFVGTLKSLLRETNQQKIKTIISLLQSEFIINKKAIHIKYKIIEDNKFMLILTDISAKKILQKKIDKERNILKMVVAVVSDSEEFFELIDDFKEFIDVDVNIVDNSKTPLHNATELYRLIHTFKGLFAQKDMNSLALKLHSIEDKLSSMISNQKFNNKDLITLVKESSFDKYLQKDIEIIREVLGEAFFDKKGKVIVEEQTLSKIEEKILKLAEKNDKFEAYETVVNDIKSLKYKTIYSLFSGYPKLIDQLSSKLEKSIYPLDIIVDKDLKVEDSFKVFIKSLIHVFRNAVDHGIESMDERYESGKDEVGTITCAIKKQEDNLHISIADDGRGIDMDKIKQKAIDLGIDIEALDADQLNNLIFNDRLSTSSEVSDISGRGVGMAAVKAECDKLNGLIKINSQKNIGTSIEFIIPSQKG